MEKETTPEERLDRLEAIDRVLQAQGIDIADLSQADRINVWEGFHANEGESYRVNLAGVQFRPDYNQDKEPFAPATPAKITPSRRKGIERDHQLYVALGDAQIDYRRMEDNELNPLHDERALAAARFIIKDLMPDAIVNLGDWVDLSSLSKFKNDSDHFHRTIGPSFQRAHDFYAGIRADNPDSTIVEVSSNHEIRLRDWVLRYMPQLYGTKRPGQDSDYPVMSYPYLANLEHVGVEWVGGYGAAEYVVNDDLSFRHGTENSSASTTAAAKTLKNRPDINTVQGHDHRESRAFRTDRNGRYIGAVVVGCLAKTTGEVPGYHSAVDDLNEVVHSQQNWQQGLLVIRDYGNGEYEYQPVPIHNGVGRYNGREYDGNN